MQAAIGNKPFQLFVSGIVPGTPLGIQILDRLSAIQNTFQLTIQQSTQYRIPYPPHAASIRLALGQHSYDWPLPSKKAVYLIFNGTDQQDLDYFQVITLD